MKAFLLAAALLAIIFWIYAPHDLWCGLLTQALRSTTPLGAL